MLAAALRRVLPLFPVCVCRNKPREVSLSSQSAQWRSQSLAVESEASTTMFCCFPQLWTHKHFTCSSFKPELGSEPRSGYSEISPGLSRLGELVAWTQRDWPPRRHTRRELPFGRQKQQLCETLRQPVLDCWSARRCNRSHGHGGFNRSVFSVLAAGV